LPEAIYNGIVKQQMESQKVNTIYTHCEQKKKVCDATHEKVPNGKNGVISRIVQRTFQGIRKQISETFLIVSKIQHFYWKKN